MEEEEEAAGRAGTAWLLDSLFSAQAGARGRSTTSQFQLKPDVKAHIGPRVQQTYPASDVMPLIIKCSYLLLNWKERYRSSPRDAPNRTVMPM